MKPGNVRIRVLSLGTHAVFDEDTYVGAYDPEDGLSMPLLTLDPEQAMVFPNIEAAIRRYQTVDPLVPVRHDGRPNRPLTAFTVEFQTLTEQGEVQPRGDANV